MGNILLVEDDPFLIDIYNAKFKEAGFDIDVATDGEECLKKLEEKMPELLLLDIVLPNVDGWEILRKIKNNAKLKNLKVIILSNLSQKEDVEKGKSFGVIKFLIKSQYTPSEVLEEVKKVL